MRTWLPPKSLKPTPNSDHARVTEIGAGAQRSYQQYENDFMVNAAVLSQAHADAIASVGERESRLAEALRRYPVYDGSERAN